MERRIDLPAEAVNWGDSLLEALRVELDRLHELEDAAKTNIALPDGFEWHARLHVGVIEGGHFAIRSTLIPRVKQ